MPITQTSIFMKNIIYLILVSLFILAFCFQQDKRTANFPKKEEFPGKLPLPKNFWIFIMAGQSNMAGRGIVETQDTVPDPRILALNKENKWIIAKEPLHFYQPKLTGLDCGMSFAHELLKFAGDSISIGLVPCAVGGSSVDNWLNDSVYNNVRLFSNFREKFEVARHSGKIKAILWHQGESDAFPEKIPFYKNKIETLFTHFREVAKNDSLPIIMGELGSFYYPKERQPLWDSINVRIRNIGREDDYCFIVPTNDLTSNDDRIHFSAVSQRELGKRYAEKYKYIFYFQN